MIMSLFGQERPKINLIKEGDFREGLVLRMKPGYYTKNPYYVLIKKLTSKSMTFNYT